MAISATYDPATGLLFVMGESLGQHIEIGRDIAGTIRIDDGAIAIQGGVATVTNTVEISVLDGNGSSFIELDESNGALPSAHLVGPGGDDSLYGGLGDDLLEGGAGTDLLSGGDGADVLIGGPGADRLFGGSSTDTASYENSSAGVTVSLTDHAGSTGDAAGDTLTDIENLTGSAFADTLIGDAGTNVLVGGGGDDLLTGGDGNDTLIGGQGADILVGGNGINTLSYVGSAAGVAVNLATGTAGGGDAQGDGFSGIEDLIGSALADTLIGDAGDNMLTGGAGADQLFGGFGTDTASYAGSSAGVLADLETRSGVGGDAQGDIFADIENLIGSDFADTLIGDEGDNVLTGGAGADVLIGGFGIDTASYAGSSAGVNVSLKVGAGIGGDAQGDTLTFIENLTGSDFADILAGNAGNNVLAGGAGDDRLVGGGGNDTLNGGDGTDTAAFSGARRNYRVDMLANDDLRIVDLRAGSPDGTTTLRSIEKLAFTDVTVAATNFSPALPQNDFSGDGNSDVLWRNDNGAMAEWQMNGTTISQSLTPASDGTPASPDASWSPQAKPTNFG